MGTRVTALIVAATVVCALGTGFYMQERAELQQAAEQATRNVPIDLPTDPDTGKLVLQDVTFTSALPPTRTPRSGQSDIGATSLRCDAGMTLTPMPDAFLQVEIEAPCRAGERMTLHHGGVMITEALDPSGRFTGLVPALTAHAVVIADFASGRDLEASTRVADLDSVERIALQWQGNSGLEVHALEFGATYGESGHVWIGSGAGQGAGELRLLGDPAQVAAQLMQVYTLPKHAGTGTVAVSVEAEITAQNCDRSVSAQLIERRDNRLQSRELSLIIPDCSAAGDFLVLNNLVESLKIAAN